MVCKKLLDEVRSLTRFVPPMFLPSQSETAVFQVSDRRCVCVFDVSSIYKVNTIPPDDPRVPLLRVTRFVLRVPTRSVRSCPR